MYEFEFFKDLEFRNVKKGMYMVGDLGSVRNKITGVYLSTSKSEKGYTMVSLMCDDNKQHTFKLHRIVGINFLGDRSSEGLELDHVDGDKDHNYASNLEWITHEENIRRANERGLIQYKSGEDMYNAKFTEKDVRYICAMMESGLSNKQIKKICKRAQVDITRYNLFDIRHRKNYRDITSEYNY